MARTKAATPSAVDLDFAFFTDLLSFYRQNRKKIRRGYKEITKRFLDWNDPGAPDAPNPTGFLRAPQFEALEIYVFLKEGLGNATVSEIFKAWREKTGGFEGRASVELFEDLDKAPYDAVFERMRRHMRAYPNYIFALTMGTGKTILMATCIFYEFLLSNKFPKDERFCHNALVFAPDKTVLQSLREIQTFEMARVVPPEYVSVLERNIKFHYLDEAGATLNLTDLSKFNLIISNSQKIILKRQNKDKTPTDRLFGSGKPTFDSGSVYENIQDLYGFDQPDDEDSLTTNQRFEKLRRLEQLGIYIDEAHHAFGNDLAKDMGFKEAGNSLRKTVDELAASLSQSKTRVVACFNFTGTPYVGREVLPEVVYAYSLQDAIKNAFLKNVHTEYFSNTRTDEFVKLAVDSFLKRTKTGADLETSARYEGMLPKLAFFAATIDELENDLRPAVERALEAHGIPTSRILVNVGDEKLTKNDDIREFNQLDTARSEKQFILLVNKGREGWNCRSLFGVALFREPRSKVFVLQATMRCLRSITDVQQTGNIYLSLENKAILENELEQNFRVSLSEITSNSDDKETYEVRPVPPPVTIKLQRVQRIYVLKDKALAPGVSLEFELVDTEKYRLEKVTEEGLPTGDPARNRATVEDITHLRRRREFSAITLVAEVARYLNKPCLEIGTILESTKEGIATIVEQVNGFNELLYDWVIPRLFKMLYDLKEFESKTEYQVDLVRVPADGVYRVRAKPEMVSRVGDFDPPSVAKSFHLDTYAFDSNPERDLFHQLLREGKVKKLYFTGMLTHGQSEFFVQYIDPESHTVRSYYPDFLVQLQDGSYLILEVKADNMIDDTIVQAKKSFAQQMAAASGMHYEIIKASDATDGRYDGILAR